MSNVDIEIYLSQLINFFESNPNDLMELIGDIQKEDFYRKLKEKCEQNHKNGEDIVLTKNQIVDIVVDLKMPELQDKVSPKKDIEGVIEKTKFGDIFLN